MNKYNISYKMAEIIVHMFLTAKAMSLSEDKE